MIIWLASYPRSGNTFFRMLLHYSCGLKTYSIYNDPLFDSLNASETIGQERLPAPLGVMAESPENFIVKTHDLPADGNPAIVLVRDGRDALVSFARYVLSFETGIGIAVIPREPTEPGEFQSTLERLIIGKERYSGWSDHVLAWLNPARGGRQIVIAYEDLVVNPDHWIRLTTQRFGLEPASVVGPGMPKFETLHRQWPGFFRKGKAGSWREEMPTGLHELFWQHHADGMNALGYRR